MQIKVFEWITMELGIPIVRFIFEEKSISGEILTMNAAKLH